MRFSRVFSTFFHTGIVGRCIEHLDFVIQRADLAAEFFTWFKELFPAAFHFSIGCRCVIGKAGCPPKIGRGVFTIRIVFHGVVWLGDIFEILKVFGINLGCQTFLDHHIDHVVGRNGNVIARCACLKLCQHGFVGIIDIQRDLNAGFLFELFHQFRRKVVRPVIEKQFTICFCRPNGQQGKGRCS